MFSEAAVFSFSLQRKPACPYRYRSSLSSQFSFSIFDHTMADAEETPVREWEVVTLTASAYAAAPGPVKSEVIDDESSDSARVDAAKTSDPLFMSGHFVLPSDQPENVSVQTENKEIQSVHESEYAVESGDFGCQSISDERFKSEIKDQDEINIEGIDISENIPGIHIDGKGKLLSVGATEFEENDGVPVLGSIDKEESIYSCAELGSSIMNEITAVEESSVTEVVELEYVESDSSITDSESSTKKDYDACDLPCGAWWKRKAVSVYVYAKEANAFWSVFVAATVMGLVIIGQRWQRENWQTQQLKWQSSISDEKAGKMFGPLARLKEVFVGGHRQASFIKGSSSADH